MELAPSTLEEWYSLLQQYASERGTVGLPVMENISAYYDSGYTVEDTYDTLFPRQPVTVIDDGVVGINSLREEQNTQELAIANGVPEPSVTEQDVMKKIVRKTFTLLPGGTTVICEIVMQNGFVAHGQSIMGAGETSNTSAQAKALTNAVREVWDKEVYLFREMAYRAHLAEIAKASIGITDQSKG
jgi:hypothetical protein